MKNWLGLVCLFILHFSFFIVFARAQALVTVADTLRNADNTLASGRLEISWPAFKTADGFTVAAGRKNHTVTAGAVSLPLFPNAGATPAGTSYTVDYYLTSGAGREYWVVPASGPVTIAGIRVSVAPAPSVLVIQSQLALGTGLNVLLGLSRWTSGAQPAATAGGQCYYDTTADLMKCSNNTLAFAPVGGIQSLNSLTAATQSLSIGTSGNDFNISSSGNVHTFHLPNASATARGAVSTGTQTFAGLKTFDTFDNSLGGTVGVLGLLRPNNASGTKFYAEGVEGDALSAAAGTITILAGLASYAEQGGTGTVDNMYGLLVNGNFRSAGTVTNNYGIFVGEQAGVGANNWAIRTQSGKVEFGDAVTAKNINAIRYASQFTGANACAKIAAAIADLPTSGGTVDARGLEGAQVCTSNPVAGVTKPLLLLLGTATYTIDVQWVYNAAITLRGIHPSNYPGSPDGTVIKASASFPTSTALIKLGAGVSSSHNTRIENVLIDCNNKTGGIGVLGDKLAEKSGVFDSTIYNCQDAGVKIADSSSQLWTLDHIEIYSSVALLSTTNGIEIDGATAPLIGTIRNVTVFPVTTVINAAVYLNNCHGGTIQNIHGENVSSVVQVGDATAVTGVTIDHVSGSSAGPVVDVVKIANLAGTTGIRISGVKKYGATNSINDLKSGFTIAADSQALYTVGDTYFNSGKAAIGKGAANQKLDVNGNIWASNGSSATNPDGNANNFVVAGDSTGAGGVVGEFHAIGNSASGNMGLFGFSNYNLVGADKRIAFILGATDGANNSGNVQFWTYNAGTAAEAMRISKSGGVSLGTTTDPGLGNFLVGGNIQTKSGTTFTGTLDHSITADRTWTLPDAAGNIPALPTAATTESGSGAVVRQTSPSITSPTLAGTPVIGDGAGNDKLSFAAESSNPSCAAGNFYIWANSTDNRLKKCQNGSVSDLDTTASGGGYDTLKGDSGTATRTGAEAIKVAGTAGEISTSAADGTDDTVTVSLPSTLSTAKSVSALWTFDRGATSDQAILIAIAQPGAAGQRDSHFLEQRGTSFDTGGHNADWRRFVDVTSNAGASSLTWQSRIDAASFTTRAALSDGGVFDVATGFRIGGAATSGRFLRGNGTNFVQSSGAASGTGSCANQFVRAVNDDAAPTCATVVAADADSSLAKTGSANVFTATGGLTMDNQLAVRLREASGNGTNFTGFVAPSAITTDNVYEMPESAVGFFRSGTIASGVTPVTIVGETGSGSVVRATSPTNVTLDVEGTGNSITTVEKIWIPGATCVSGTATLNWDDDPAAAEPTAACVAGTNITKGAADFLDTASNAMQTHIKLPSDWTGAVDVKFVWFTTATANNVVWQIQGVCVADAETDDPSFGTASTVTDAAKGTANQLNDATITGIQANFGGSCAAGELLHLRMLRDPAHASDNLGATARLYGVELTLRRAQ